jgi:hexokinase
MGKGFHASDGMLNRDLGAVIGAACRARGLSVSLLSIMNDSDACLFAEAYVRPGTRMGLVLGTGTNVSCYLPVASFARAKFGDGRDPRWFEAAAHVVVNVELGCCGQGGVMPATRWDDVLAREHPTPDFQPLEYFTSGRYLGEICRLVLIEAIETTGAFGGVVPPSLTKAYSLDSEVLSEFEAYVVGCSLVRYILDRRPDIVALTPRQ